jgi:hypothetical protein
MRIQKNESEKIINSIQIAKIQKRAKAFRRINRLKCLAGIKWGADQGMLLRVHEMMVLSALEYGRRRTGGIENRTWSFLRVQNRKHYV